MNKFETQIAPTEIRCSDPRHTSNALLPGWDDGVLETSLGVRIVPRAACPACEATRERSLVEEFQRRIESKIVELVARESL